MFCGPIGMGCWALSCAPPRSARCWSASPPSPATRPSSGRACRRWRRRRGRRWRALDKTLEQEYFDLFVGVGRGELLPYGSYYLAGFLYEKPLARLRGDMRRLGIARAEGVHEPEDHIAALMEMMSGLITGAFGQPAELATQRQFFAAHIGSWAPRFFEDLESAEAADFYRSVGRVARQFVAIEAEAFEMTA
jgi:TorA maturation chaperone TorD